MDGISTQAFLFQCNYDNFIIMFIFDTWLNYGRQFFKLNGGKTLFVVR